MKLYKLEGKLVAGRSTTYVTSTGKTIDSVIVNDGMDTLVVDKLNPYLSEDTGISLVSFTHTHHIKIGNTATGNVGQIVDEYSRQCALITQNGYVPIPSFTDEHSIEHINSDITFDEAVGCWSVALTDIQMEPESGDIVLTLSMLGYLFRERLDPDGHVDETNAHEKILTKIFYVDAENGQQFEEDSPYSLFQVGLAVTDYIRNDVPVEEGETTQPDLDEPTVEFESPISDDSSEVDVESK